MILTKRTIKKPKLFVGTDPSFKGFGVAVIKFGKEKPECHITQLKADFVVKDFIGYCKAAFQVAEQLDDLLYTIEECKSPAFILAEHPPAGGGGHAMATQPLYALGAITYGMIGYKSSRQYHTLPPSKAGWMANCPRKISTSDKKRLTKEYAVELLQRCNFDVHHRGKHIGDITTLRTKTKPTKPKQFNMSHNEAEAFLYACLGVRHFRQDQVPVVDANKHWTLALEY